MPTHRLILMRHAKSSWVEEVEDLQRPLSMRGRREAKAAASSLATLEPQLAVASPACRCVQTLEMLGTGGLEMPIQCARHLYSGDVASAVEFLRTLPGAHHCVLVVCHYPTVSKIVKQIARCEPGNRMWSRLDERFPTSAYAVVEIDAPWTELGVVPGRLVKFETPRS